MNRADAPSGRRWVVPTILVALGLSQGVLLVLQLQRAPENGAAYGLAAILAVGLTVLIMFAIWWRLVGSTRGTWKSVKRAAEADSLVLAVWLDDSSRANLSGVTSRRGRIARLLVAASSVLGISFSDPSGNVILVSWAEIREVAIDAVLISGIETPGLRIIMKAGGESPDLRFAIGKGAALTSMTAQFDEVEHYCGKLERLRRDHS